VKFGSHRSDIAGANRSNTEVRAGERGYTLLLAVFLVACALIATTIAVPNIITQGKREQEIEMVWRGHQYEKAIGRYVRKFNRNPTKIDDLVKGVNGVRYLRQAYKDPMNDADGSWRFIYVTGGGALIGSVRYTSLQQMALMDRLLMGQTGMAGMPGMAMGSIPGGVGFPGAGLLGGLAASQSGSGFGGFSTFGPGGQNGQNGGPGNAGQCPPGGSTPTGNSPDSGSPPDSGGSPQNPVQPCVNVPLQNGSGGATGFGGFGQTPGANGIGSSIGQPIGSPLGTTTIGGNIAGVGSKIDKPSLIVYKLGKKYKQWEFIYNPLEQQETIGGSGGGVPGAVPAGQTTSPFGGQGQGPSQSPFGGQPTPPELPQSPTPQPSPGPQQ
jgi:hypothetical protein